MKQKRFFFGCILLSILILLMVYYSLDHNNHDPSPEYILNHYEQFNNTKVAIGGEVKNIDKTNHTLVIQINSSSNGVITVSTNESLNNTHQGDIVEVYGTLTSKNHIIAEKLFISERWKYDLIYIRSLPAIPFALYLFFRAYHYNTKTFRFERRKKNA